MDRHRECAQYVEGRHVTDVRSDFEGHLPTVIVIFIARSFYLSEVGLVLLHCPQITFDPLSLKTGPTPSLVSRHSPVIEDPHSHGRRLSLA